MPIQRIKNSVHQAAHTIRQHWTQQETQRREQMADLMQTQLLTALGFVPAPCPQPVMRSTCAQVLCS